MSANPIVRRLRHEDVLPVGDRVAPTRVPQRPVEVREAEDHRQEDLRLNESLPERLHQLPPEQRQQVGAFLPQSGELWA